MLNNNKKIIKVVTFIMLIALLTTLFSACASAVSNIKEATPINNADIYVESSDTETIIPLVNTSNSDTTGEVGNPTKNDAISVNTSESKDEVVLLADTVVDTSYDVTVNASGLGSDGKTYTPITAGGTITAGNYYLANDITLTETIKISGEVNLALNGHVIDGANITDKNKASVITVSGNATLNLYGDGKDYTCTNTASKEISYTGGLITGGTGELDSSTYTKGGGVYVSDGTFNMHGGTIAKNEADNGGGVCIFDDGTFTIQGSAKISHNEAECGGAIYATPNISGLINISINGGELSYNNTTHTIYGGGALIVYAQNSDRGVVNIEMTDGLIVGNKSIGHGSAFYLEDGRDKHSTFKMSGGTIIGNTSDRGGCINFNTSELETQFIGGEIINNVSTSDVGGIRSNSCPINILGNFVIKGNVKGGTATCDEITKQVTVTGGTPSNVKIGSDLIKINTVLTGIEQIGISMKDGTGTFATGVDSADYAKYFFADDSNCYIEVTQNTEDNTKFDYSIAPLTEVAKMVDQYNATVSIKNNGTATYTIDGTTYTTANVPTEGVVTTVDGEEVTVSADHIKELLGEWKTITAGDPLTGSIFEEQDKLNSYPAGNYYVADNIDLNRTITFTGKTNLALNGKVLNCDTVGIVNLASVIRMKDEAAILNLYGDGKTYDGTDAYNGISYTGGLITGGHGTDRNGGGVQVLHATFNMYGGTIAGNSASYGGGVTASSASEFNMYGGIISRNEVTKKDYESIITMGSGVYVNGSTFNMYGGTISQNNSKHYGGGVCVDNGATFNMKGGTISGNTATSKGAGVYVSDGELYISDYPYIW